MGDGSRGMGGTACLRHCRSVSSGGGGCSPPAGEAGRGHGRHARSQALTARVRRCSAVCTRCWRGESRFKAQPCEARMERSTRLRRRLPACRWRAATRHAATLLGPRSHGCWPGEGAHLARLQRGVALAAPTKDAARVREHRVGGAYVGVGVGWEGGRGGAGLRACACGVRRGGVRCGSAWPAARLCCARGRGARAGPRPARMGAGRCGSQRAAAHMRTALPAWAAPGWPSWHHRARQAAPWAGSCPWPAGKRCGRGSGGGGGRVTGGGGGSGGGGVSRALQQWPQARRNCGAACFRRHLRVPAPWRRRPRGGSRAGGRRAGCGLCCRSPCCSCWRRGNFARTRRGNSELGCRRAPDTRNPPNRRVRKKGRFLAREKAAAAAAPCLMLLI